MEPMLDGGYQEDGVPSTGMQNNAMSPMRYAISLAFGPMKILASATRHLLILAFTVWAVLLMRFITCMICSSLNGSLPKSLCRCRSASEVQLLRPPGSSIEELGMLEGGEEAQGDDQTAFTARTAHVAARLKVLMHLCPITIATAVMQHKASAHPPVLCRLIKYHQMAQACCMCATYMGILPSAINASCWHSCIA